MRVSKILRPRVFAPILGMAVVTAAMVAAAYASRSQATATAGTPASSATAASQVLFIDQITGQPRAATAQELEQLRQMQGDVAVTPPLPIVSQVGNLQGLQLSDDQMVYSVATKKADGTLGMQEVVGKQAADAAVRRGAPVLTVTAGKDQRNDR